jgi:hypothetical protein
VAWRAAQIHAPSTLPWLGGLIILVAGVALPLIIVAVRNRSSLSSTTPSWRRD